MNVLVTIIKSLSIKIIEQRKNQLKIIFYFKMFFKNNFSLISVVLFLKITLLGIIW